MVYSYMGAKCRLKNVILKKDQVAKGDEKLQSDEKLQKVMKSCKRWWKMGEKWVGKTTDTTPCDNCPASTTYSINIRHPSGCNVTGGGEDTTITEHLQIHSAEYSTTRCRVRRHKESVRRYKEPVSNDRPSPDMSHTTVSWTSHYGLISS